MTWMLLGWVLILLGCVAGLSTLFWNWMKLGFAIQKTTDKVVHMQAQAAQLKRDIEDLKGRVK